MNTGADGEMSLSELRAALTEGAVEIASGKGVIVSDPHTIAESIVRRGQARLDRKR